MNVRQQTYQPYIPQVALAMRYCPSTAPLDFVFDPELQAETEKEEKKIKSN